MGQIALVKLREGRSRSSRGDDVELVPAQAAEPAITVSVALKVPSVVRLKRKVRDRTGRNQSHNCPLAFGVQAADIGNAAQEDIGFAGESSVAKNNFMLFEITHGEPAREVGHLRSGEP